MFTTLRGSSLVPADGSDAGAYVSLSAQAQTPSKPASSTDRTSEVARKIIRRLMAAGCVAANLLVATPAAHANPSPPAPSDSTCLQCGSGASGQPIPAAPRAPGIGTATSGLPGGAITAKAAWVAPSSTGTSEITGYRVYANRVEPRFNASTQTVLWAVVSTTTSAWQPASARNLSMTLSQPGTYSFIVQTRNSVGESALSESSNRVTGQ
jgi:hypothetical protein